MINRRVITLVLLTLAMFLIATNVQASLLYIVSATLFALVAVSYLVPLAMVRRLRAVRRVPAETFEGVPVPVRAELTNNGRIPRFLIRVRDDLVEGVGKAIVWIPPGEAGKIDYRASLTRGVYTSARMTLSCGAPFGVWERKKTIEVGAGIVAYPRYEEISTFPLLEAMSSPSETLHERRGAGAGYDYLGVREYRSGDSMRSVHWRSTARRGELVVKEFEEELSTPVNMIIDAGSKETMDAAARVAATLANYCLKAGHPLRLTARGADGVIRIERPGLYPALEWLAGLNPGEKLGLAGIVDEAIPFISQRSTAVIVASAQRADWVAIAAAVQSRRARLIIVLIDAAGYGETGAPAVKEIAAELAGERVTLYGLEKNQEIRECLREPLSATDR